MELMVASGVGLATMTGIYLILRAQTFPVVLGLTFLSYAVNVYLFAMGRLMGFNPAVGPVVIQVPEEHAEKALEMLGDLRNGNLEPAEPEPDSEPAPS